MRPISLIHRIFSSLSCERGNVALLFGFAAPVFIGITGLALDGASMNRQHVWMQNTSDSVALAVAKELNLYRDKPGELQSVAEARIGALIETSAYASSPHEIEAAVSVVGNTVTVAVAMVHKNFVPLDVFGENPIRVSATARAYGSARLCVLGLNANAPRTIRAERKAVLTAPECAVQSNSTAKDSLALAPDAQILSAGTCSSGGIENVQNIVGSAETDCAVIDDPLGSRVPPTVSGCDFLDFKLEKGGTTLVPGTYCGGIKLGNNAVVRFEPGTYVITGGPIDMGDSTEIHGEGVSFYFEDEKSTFDIRDKGLVELSAPEDGPMAGILFYGNPATERGREFKISSNSARKLLGTIYLPNADLKITGAGDVAEESAYTIIIANKITIEESNLVVNARYSETDVPVPDGLGPRSGQIVLER